jgi:hypothetical protein
MIAECAHLTDENLLPLFEALALPAHIPMRNDRRRHRHRPEFDGMSYCTMIVPTIIGWIEQ